MEQKWIEWKEEIDKSSYSWGLQHPYLNITINQQDVINIYRTLYPTTVEYTFFSSPHGIYIPISSICSVVLQTSTNLKKLKVYRLSDQKGLKLETN